MLGGLLLLNRTVSKPVKPLELESILRAHFLLTRLIEKED
jgi:hypothetical protein